MTYDEVRALIETLGVHPVLGPVGQGMNIEQNPHELATFLTELPFEVKTVLEIGTGYRAGLARFMAEHLHWQVTTVDIVDYGHAALYPAIRFVVLLPFVPPHLAEQYDLVIIDANHSYHAVSTDYGTYSDLGRLVMLHDIAGDRMCEGVARFWREIAYTKAGKLRAGFHEVIDEGEFRAGIGWAIQ